MPVRRQHAALLTAAALAALAPASAQATTSSGGASVPSLPSVPVQPPRQQPRPSTPSGSSALSVASFTLNGSHFFEYGRSIRASFQVAGRSGSTARVKLVVVRAGKREKVVDLGQREAGSQQSYTLPTGGLPDGALELRLAARDARGRALKTPGSRAIDIRSHRFPIVGSHNYGNAGARFGAPRTGHVHQGQDVMAAEGTPLVAARGGTVRFAGYQAGGAGVYAVIHGAGEGRDYVYMHMVQGSMLVKTGQSVRTGQLIGKVGQTGAAEGPHLHFEIWQGVWQGGGKPVDPLSALQAWDAWS